MRADNGLMSDDPTKEIGETQYDTKPGMTAVLERINQLGEQLRGEFAGISTRLESLESEIASLRADMQKEFRQIQRQFDRLAGEMSRQGATLDDHEERFQKLEEKAS